MIKANELRIGNRINNFIKDEGFFETIVDIDVLTFIQNHDNCDCDFCYDYYYSPIPISKKLLLECGFSFGDLSLELGHFTDSKLWFNEKSNQCRLVDSNGKYLTHDKLVYVHQLQNLYFSITGKELVFSSTEP